MHNLGKRLGKFARRLLAAVAVVVLFLAAALIALPFYIKYVPIPEIAFDASQYLTGNAARLVKNKSISAKVSVARGEHGGLRLTAAGRLLDWPFTSTANISMDFSRIKGDFSAKLDKTDLELVGDFAYHSKKDWRFSARVPEARFSSDDAVLGQIIPRLELASVSNIVCSGALSLSADGACTKEKPVPEWKVSGALKNVDASLVASDRQIVAKNFRMKFGAKGLADWHSIDPMFPRADMISIPGTSFTNVFASIRATDRAYLVTEAGADCAGGTLKLYALFLDPERLSAGATIYVEDVDAGEALSYVSGISGDATGRLHGKMSFFLRDGKTLRLRDAFLFSNPGDVGTVRIYDGKALVGNLAMGGLPADECRNLATAIANLDYSVLRLRLKKDKAAGGSALSLKIKGTATHEGITVPVNLDVTLRGDIDQLIDTGMKIKRSRQP